ncbi:MAG: FAD-dependent oxidoreductase [Proteobacteria bacterium]|nr:FAD-dependent oxidoreductase [Pseudomonadota bacterium]
MPAGESIVIVGAGQAGGRAAEALRKAGFAGRVMLVGEEAEPPYERPPLSKAVLLGEKPPESTRLLPEAFYAEQRIELATGMRAVAIDAGAQRLELADGRPLAYDQLLLATGGRVRRLASAPPGRPGIHYLRTIGDSLALAGAMRAAKRLVVIGGGFLGLEGAASARKLGLEVVVLEAKPSLLDRAMAPEIAQAVAALHRAKGVALCLGVSVSEIIGRDRIESVALSDGSRIAADLVLVAIGILPNSELALAAGARVEDGIIVNEFAQTSLPGIYAVGDVARHPNRILGRSLRLESWQNAQNQAIAAAGAMAGAPRAYAEVPWFWSDQHGVNIQMVGAPAETERVVWRGERSSGRFMAFNLAKDIVVGATAFNMGGEIRFARQLIEQGARIDPADLADPARKLKDLAAG